MFGAHVRNRFIRLYSSDPAVRAHRSRRRVVKEGIREIQLHSPGDF